MTDVFISYASQDRARARMLADALEARGLSVWWDRKIDPGRTFAKVIEDQLGRAKSVVVLWSRHSVVSEWVKNEAAVALESDTLVPALIDTVKLPLEFRHKQTVDLIGWEGDAEHVEFDALCRGIAAHVQRDLPPQPHTPPPDEAKGRNLRHSDRMAPPTQSPIRKPGPRVSVFLRAVIAVMILAGVGLWYWDAFQRQHIEYYANVIKRWGLPEGVGRLTDEQVRHRNVTLAFVKRGRWGAVQEIRAVNSRGAYPPVSAYFPSISLANLNPFTDVKSGLESEFATICRVTFKRDADGRILNQSAYNRSDRLLYTLHYAQPDIAEYKVGAFSKVVRPSGITHIKFIRPESGPEAGLDKELLLLDSTGKLQPDHDGTYGYRFTFNALGLPVEWINLGADGQPAVDRVGIAKATRTYDGQGNITQEVYLGPNGQPVLHKQGSAEMRMSHDQYGNVKEAAFFGTDGQLVTSKEFGAAGRTFAYDDHGNIIENTSFGPDRQLTVGSWGFAKQTIAWDEKGRSLETYFGPDGKAMLIFGRAVKLRGVWDERGYPVEVAALDENGRPIRDDEGCAKKSFAYDKDGNQTETACFDEGSEPVRAKSGAAQAKRIYDERGNRVEESYFGPDGRPELYEENYVKIRSKYNEQGKEVEVAYFDAAGKPVKNTDGYAKTTNSYDLQGKVIEVLFFDEKGRPIDRKGGYARIVRAYDERGNMIEETQFDAQGKPSRGESGYFKAKYAYDDRGYRTETAFFDERDQAILNIDGYAKVREKYSDKGQLIELSFFGLEDSPVVAKKYGSAKVRRTYNARGRLSRIDYFNASDRLARQANGYATIRLFYDDLGRETKREFYDVGGARVVTRVTIDKVENGSKSHRVGLQAGDVLLDYDGGEVANKHVFDELELVKGERPRELSVERNGKLLNFHVPAGRLKGIETVDKVPADLGRASESVHKKRHRSSANMEPSLAAVDPRPAEEEGTKRIQESDHGSVAYVQASDAVQLSRSGEYHRRTLLHFHKVQKAASLATIV